MISYFLARNWLPLFLDVSIKSTAVLLAGALAALVLRRASAAARHLVWLLALGSLLCLPLLSAVVPGWHLPLARIPWALSVGAASGAVTPLPVAAPQFSAAAPAVPVPTASISAAPGAAGSSASESSPFLPAKTTTSSSKKPDSSPWPARILLVWLAGVLATLIPLLAGMTRIRRVSRGCRPLTGGPIAAMACRLAQEMGVRRPVRLLLGVSALPVSPMTWGCLRPVVLLPADACDWPEERLRAVLLHELAHAARGDWPAQMLAQGTCACYWFHPLAWLAARRLRSESEWACDDRVLGAGVLASDYAQHLLDIVRISEAGRFQTVMTMAQTTPIEDRLRAILATGRHRQAVTRPTVVAAAVMVLAFLTLLAALHPVAWAQAGTTAKANVSVHHGAPDWAEGPVRSVKFETVDAVLKGRRWIEGPRYLRTYTVYSRLKVPMKTVWQGGSPGLNVTVYDSAGREISTAEYTPSGRLYTKSVSRYDDEGRLKEEATYHSDGAPGHRAEYSYDPATRQETQWFYSAPEHLPQKSVTTKDAQGNVLEIVSYDAHGAEVHHAFYHYDAHGRDIGQEDYDQGALVSKIVRRRDPITRQTEVLWYQAKLETQPDGTNRGAPPVTLWRRERVRRTATDARGNWTRSETLEWVYHNGQPSRPTKFVSYRTIAYYPRGESARMRQQKGRVA